MTSLILSEEEKHFIISGVEEDFRIDGRSCEDYRMINVETGIISNTSGSAQVKLVSEYNFCRKLYQAGVEITSGHRT